MRRTTAAALALAGFVAVVMVTRGAWQNPAGVLPAAGEQLPHAAQVTKRTATPSPVSTTSTTRAQAPVAAPAGPPIAAADPALYDTAIPLRERLASLDAHARRGDARAACTMAREVDRCRRAARRMRHQPQKDAMLRFYRERGATPEQLERTASSLDAQAREFEAMAGWCEGFDARDHLPSVRYHLIAAEAGFALSMREALRESRYPTELLFREPQLIAQYRATAPRYFHALAEAADPRLLEMLEQAARSEASLLLETLPQPYGSRGFAQALTEHVRAARGLRPAPPGEVEPSEAERLAAVQFFDAYFHGVPPRPTFDLAWNTRLESPDPCTAAPTQ